MRSALTQLDTPAPRRERRYHVFGRVLTRRQVLEAARALHDRGDHAGSLRVLDAAGLWPHDLVEWSER